MSRLPESLEDYVTLGSVDCNNKYLKSYFLIPNWSTDETHLRLFFDLPSGTIAAWNLPPRDAMANDPQQARPAKYFSELPVKSRRKCLASLQRAGFLMGLSACARRTNLGHKAIIGRKLEMRAASQRANEPRKPPARMQEAKRRYINWLTVVETPVPETDSNSA